LLKNWGYLKLAEQVRSESIDEMRHADQLMERILVLEGLPNLQTLGKLMIGQNLKESLECDLRLELQGRPQLIETIAHCESVRDSPSRELFESILESEEEHIDWMETQLALIADIGIRNYQQSQI
jgi:bacterioferritin